MIKQSQLKLAALKAMIVLLPSYTAALLTDKMVYVVPTLAAAGIFAASLESVQTTTRNRVDDEADEAIEGAVENTEAD
ncbi:MULTISPECIES: hypothetical protein [unclassified Marinovum]|uniref:hypothetical protein n=1 Tax=unclassified Marinovum TaxID=2647166 RepID=UPI003EDC1E33